MSVPFYSTDDDRAIFLMGRGELAQMHISCRALNLQIKELQAKNVDATALVAYAKTVQAESVTKAAQLNDLFMKLMAKENTKAV